MDSNLTLEEMEREAYQRGETQRAELLRLALDGELSSLSELECEAEGERERADEAERAYEELQNTIATHLNKVEDAIASGDKSEIQKAIAKAREEI